MIDFDALKAPFPADVVVPPSMLWLACPQCGLTFLRKRSNLPALKSRPMCSWACRDAARGTPVDMFMDKVSPEPNSGCWLWTGSATRRGYGHFWVNGKCEKAHRASYRMFVGPIPDGHDVMHKCDTPSCVNPDHLRPGTRLENMSDMWAKGRGKPSPGSRNGNARMTPFGVQYVREMLWLDYTPEHIARKFRVHATTIRRIGRRINWKVAA